MKTRLNVLLPPILLFQVTFALFAPSIGYRFVGLDDSSFIYNNPIVFNGFSWESLGNAFTALHGDQVMYTPLLWVSFLFDNLCFGASPYSPWGFHFTNVLLHAANAVLLFFILRCATHRSWLAFIAAAFWAIHPLRVESVAWITERKDTLSTFFAFASILCYLKAFSGRPPTAPAHSTSVSSAAPAKGRFALLSASFFFLLCGLLSKPMLVTLPLLFLLLDFWPLERFSLRNVFRTLPRLVLRKWPFFILLFLFSALTYHLHSTSITPLPLSFRLLRLPVNYFFYFSRTIWPINLCPLSLGFPATLSWIVSACVFFLLLSIVTLLIFPRAPGILVGLFAFIGLLAPVSGIIFIGEVPVADRYSYLPSLGLALALLSLLEVLCTRTSPANAVFPAPLSTTPDAPHNSLSSRPVEVHIVTTTTIIILLGLATISLYLLPNWKDPESLAARAEKIDPNNNLSLLFRFAQSFYFNGDLQTAAAVAQNSWEKRPGSPFATLTKTFLLSQTDSSAAATAFYEDHPFTNPAHDPSLDNLPIVLAVLYADMGEFDKGVPYIEEALSNPYNHPRHAKAIASIAFWFYASQGLDAKAVEVADRVPSIDSSNLHAPANYLLSYTSMWNLGLRRQTFPRLLALAEAGHDNAALLNNIAWLLSTVPNSPATPDEVLAIARRALELAPEHPVIRDTFAVALAFAGRFDEAIALESAVADFLRNSSTAEASDMLETVEERLKLFRTCVPFTENSGLKLLFAP